MRVVVSASKELPWGWVHFPGMGTTSGVVSSKEGNHAWRDESLQDQLVVCSYTRDAQLRRAKLVS